MNKKAAMAAIALSLVLFGCLAEPRAQAGKVFAAAIIPPKGPCSPPLQGDWNVSGNEDCKEGVIALNGNIRVSGSLALNNVTVYFNSTRNGEFGILVRENGSLSIKNNSMIASTTEFKYDFRAMPGSDLWIEDSVVRDSGYSEEKPGPVAETNASIRNSIFTGNFVGLTLENAQGATVDSSLFSSNIMYGLHALNTSQSAIRGNRFDQNGGQGLFIDLSEDNAIENNTYFMTTSFETLISCEGMQCNAVQAMSQAEFTINARTSAPTSGITLRELIPRGWIVIKTNGGKVSEYNDTYMSIEWDISFSADQASKKFTLIAPPQAGEYYFYTEFASAKSDPSIVQVPGEPSESQPQPENKTEKRKNPKASKFDIVPDFANYSDLKKARVYLGKKDAGMVNWTGKVNASNADFDKEVKFGKGWVYVNSSGLDESFNSSALVTFFGLPYESTPQILADRAPCLECYIISYTGGTLVFQVPHFTNYSTNSTANSNLTIYDYNDPEGGSRNYNSSALVTFYANYTNRTSGAPIKATGDGGRCNIRFSIAPTGPYAMIFNVTGKSVYEYNRTIAPRGTYTWNVTCTATRYNIMQLLDSVTIANSPPNQTTPVLNSSSLGNTSSENLTCYNQTTRDADSDTVINAYDWRLNGSSIAVLNMPFDTNSSTSAKDYSSFGNNGAVTSTAWTSSGKSGGAYSFNGASSIITIANSQSINITEKITMSAWVTANTLDDWDVIMFKATDDSWADGYALYYFGGEICAYVNEYSAYSACKTFGTGSTWTMVTATYDGSVLSLYLNGTLAKTSEFSTSIATNSVPLAIGMTHYSSYPWDGNIDEVLVYNRSLSPEQVTALYNLQYGTIARQEISRYENWSVTVTPNDNPPGAEGASLSTANLTVKNSPPTHSTPVLNSSRGLNTTFENLTCYNQSTSDFEGDSVVNVYDWRANNRSIAVLNMPFETNSSSSVKDYSDLGKNGNVSATGPVWTTNGRVGGAYEFDGVDDQINLSSNAYNTMGSGTIAFWFKPGDQGADGGYMFSAHRYKGSNPEYYSMWFRVQDTNGTHGTLNSDWIGYSLDFLNVDFSYNITLNEWHFLAYTSDSNGNRFYLDGQDISDLGTYGGYTWKSSNAFFLNTVAYEGGLTTYYRLGVLYNASDGFGPFNGTIDELRIYNRSLSAQQISALYSLEHDKIVSQELMTGDVWKAAVTPNDGQANADGTTQMSNSLTLGSCGTIGAPGEYELTGNAMSNGTCITISADNVTLNCSGYSITGDSSGNGIQLIGASNATLRDCAIYNFSNGIYFSGSSSNRVLGDWTYWGSSTDGLYNNLCGIRFDSSSNNVVENTSLSNYDCDFALESGSGDNTALNDLFSQPPITVVDEDSNLTLGWYARVEVNEPDFGVFVPGAEVNVSDAFGNLVFSGLALSPADNGFTGATEWFAANDTVVRNESLGNVSYNEYAVNASREPFYENLATGSYGITERHQTLVIDLLYYSIDFNSSETTGGEAWKMSRYDLARSGRTSSLAPTTSNVSWTASTGLAFSEPIAWGGAVFAGASDGYMHALNQTDGSELWSVPINGSTLDSPALSNSILYFTTQPSGEGDYFFYALDASDGSTMWMKEFGYHVSSPAVKYGLVYLGGDYDFYAFDARNGETVWDNGCGECGSRNPTAPAIYGYTVYFGENADVFALNAKNGIGGIWFTFPTVGGYYPNAISAPSIYYAEGLGSAVLYVPTVVAGEGIETAYTLYAVNTENASEAWEYGYSDGISSTPAVYSGRVYLTSQNYLYALDAYDGYEYWNYPASGESIQSSPAIATSFVFFSTNATVYALTRNYGSDLWSYPVAGGTSPAAAGKMLFVGTGEGLYAFGGANGGQECEEINKDTLLYSDISASGDCFSITADDVALNCSGFSITGNGSGIGILAEGRRNITIRDCNITNFTQAVSLNATDDSLVLNVTAGNNLVGVSFDNAAGNWVSNSSLSNGNFDFQLENAAGNNAALNTLFNRATPVSVSDEDSNLTIQWYARVKAADADSGVGLPDAEANASDAFGSMLFSGSTDAYGLTEWFVANETIARSETLGNISYNDYALNASKSLLYASTSKSITSTQTISVGLPYYPSSSAQDEKEWPMLHRFLNRTGHSDSSAPDIAHVAWNYTTSGSVDTSPAIVGGIVFAVASDNYTYALNASTGQQVWNHSLFDNSNAYATSPAVAGGAVYVGVYDYTIGPIMYALNATDGSELWNYPASGQELTSPAVAGGMVLAVTLPYAGALNATDGSLVWAHYIGDGVDSASNTAFADGVMYVGYEVAPSYYGRVLALDPATGNELWNHSLGLEYSRIAQLSVAYGTIFASSDNGYMYALNATDGSELWNASTGGWCAAIPAVADGVVYTCAEVYDPINDTYTDFEYALNATDGSQIWNYPHGGVYSSPAVADGKVFFQNTGGNLTALNAYDGSETWDYPIAASGGYSSPAVADGKVFIGSPEGSVYAFDSGTAAGCGISVNESLLEFGTLGIGEESSEEALLVTNTGTSPADVLVSGTEWRTDSKTMPANATRYANQSSVAFDSKNELLDTEQTIYYSLYGSASFESYYQVKPPFGTSGGSYAQNVTLTTTC